MCNLCDRNWLGTLNFKWGQKGICGFKREWYFSTEWEYSDYRDGRVKTSYGINKDTLYSKVNRCNSFNQREYYNKRYRQYKNYRND